MLTAEILREFASNRIFIGMAGDIGNFFFIFVLIQLNYYEKTAFAFGSQHISLFL